MLTLLTEKLSNSPIPGVWTESTHSDDMTKLWRIRSGRLLQELADKRNIGANDPCICGSGDKLRLCCVLPLRA
jgi:hypothetical protein